MSSLFRLARAFRPRTTPSTFFHSNTALGRTQNLKHARFYTPRTPPPRIPIPTPTTNPVAAKQTIIYALLGINTTIYGYSIYANALAEQNYPAKMYAFIHNMTLNLNAFRDEKRYWTALTATFTHLSLTHFACNMFVFYTMGQFLVRLPIITPARFLIIVFGSGLLGSAGYLQNRARKVPAGAYDRSRGVGFSGALMGITTVAACFYPHAQMMLMGVIPMPLWVLTLGFAAVDGYFLNDETSRIGHAGHLGGMAFGAAYYLIRLRGLRI
ncbi:hypothetical protein P153DRAFT_339634 [Dothidotthia symphoricarpi CBS 119687]|uniref:Peptidase S54 rhomboid domain-containing protein n=1 Tax=Dothidotthia symphoricarpi CBS 119687 TaxID=1392245 RepID=A0A6A6AE06_9PLEO|nr:uncharacterized protein P153DRAFT_339634 [Dothidotthia symphoricarpi CBS 119687]KAF2130099.1 hypothetical protein P153DRAFT_339634 [Dothidotthia symphoricarpi CBS 119687]